MVITVDPGLLRTNPRLYTQYPTNCRGDRRQVIYGLRGDRGSTLLGFTDVCNCIREIPGLVGSTFSDDSIFFRLNPSQTLP